MEGEKPMGAHGGYRGLKGFQVAQLVFDRTVRFCERRRPPQPHPPTKKSPPTPPRPCWRWPPPCSSANQDPGAKLRKRGGLHRAALPGTLGTPQGEV